MAESVLVLFAVFGTFALVQVALAYALVRASRGHGSESDSAPPATRSSLDADGGVAGVPCPHCGVANDPTYTFCRNCVGELVGERPPDDGGDGAWSRGA